MAVTATIGFAQIPNQVDATQQQFCVDGIKLAFSGSYATHGDVLALGGLLPADSVPNRVEIYEAPPAGTSPTGYLYTYCPGTSNNLGQVVVLTTGTASGDPLNELSAGSYPAALTGTTYIYARVWLTKFI